MDLTVNKIFDFKIEIYEHLEELSEEYNQTMTFLLEEMIEKKYQDMKSKEAKKNV